MRWTSVLTIAMQNAYQTHNGHLHDSNSTMTCIFPAGKHKLQWNDQTAPFILKNFPKYCYNARLHVSAGLPLSGRTTYITPWDCHRTSKLNFKDVPRTSEISFVRPKSIPETSKNCQKARPLLTSCMMFAPPTYRKFATCVDWALRTSHFTLAGFYWQPCQASRLPFDGCVITACIYHACWVDLLMFI